MSKHTSQYIPILAPGIDDGLELASSLVTAKFAETLSFGQNAWSSLSSVITSLGIIVDSFSLEWDKISVEDETETIVTEVMGSRPSYTPPVPPAELTTPTIAASSGGTLPSAPTPSAAAPSRASVVKPNPVEAPDAPDFDLNSYISAVQKVALPQMQNVYQGFSVTHNYAIDEVKSTLASVLSLVLSRDVVANIEGAIFERMQSRQEQKNAEMYYEAENYFASRGFTLPPGTLSGKLNDIVIAISKNNVDMQRDAVVEQAKWTQSIAQVAISEAWKAAAGLLDADARAVSILNKDVYDKYLAELEATKALIQREIGALDGAYKNVASLLQRYASVVQAHGNAVQAYGYEAQMYGQDVQAFSQDVQLYGHAVQADANAVQAYGHGVQAYGYEQQKFGHDVQLQGVIAQLYGHQVQDYGHKVQKFAVDMQKYGHDIQLYEQDVKLGAIKAEGAAKNNDFKVRLAIAQAEINLKQAELNIRELERTFATKVAASDAATKAISQICASALSATNASTAVSFSAGASSSAGSSVSSNFYDGDSYQESNIQEVRLSTSQS